LRTKNEDEQISKKNWFHIFGVSMLHSFVREFLFSAKLMLFCQLEKEVRKKKDEKKKIDNKNGLVFVC